MSDTVVLDRDLQRQIGLWPYQASSGVSGTATQSAQLFLIPDRSACQYLIRNRSLDKYLHIKFGDETVVADTTDLPIRFDTSFNGTIDKRHTHFSVVCEAGETAPWNLNSGWGFV